MTDRTAAAAKLLPCPFCGGPPEYAEKSGVGQAWVECQSVGCQAHPSVWANFLARAIERWNTRPQPAPPSGEPGWTFNVQKEGRPGCHHSWAGTNFLSACLKCGAEGIWQPPGAAPPEGEPLIDFKKLARNFWMDHGAHYCDALALEFERIWKIGLAARTKVKNAEVRAHCEHLRARDNPALHQAADLLERLAGERAELVDDVRAANDLAKDVIPMVERAEAAESKLAEREAELAMAQKLICYENMSLAEQECDDDNWEDPTTRLRPREIDDIIETARKHHAARQQQKAPAEKDKP